MIPIRTNICPRCTPYANYALIGLTAAAFLLTHKPQYINTGIQPVLISSIATWAEDLQLFPKTWRIWQFVSYAFLHADVWHILGNMYFLYLFGNSVNDRLGHPRYVLFYLISAVLSGAGHAALNQAGNVPLIGASGAVAAITGAYWVLFPKSLITAFYWFIFIGTIEVRAFWFILVKLIFIDNWLSAGSGFVAYDAHLVGYAAGIVGVMTALRMKWIEREGCDLWLMIEQWNRRRQYRDSVADGYDPYSGNYGGGRKKIVSKEVAKSPEQKQREERVNALRLEISQWLSQRNVATAAQRYVDLIQLDDQQILPRQSLLDVANQLASESRYSEAAQAYETLLLHYNEHERKEQVELMLGLIFARYLNKPDKAVSLLRKALPNLTQSDQQSMCRGELSRLEG